MADVDSSSWIALAAILVGSFGTLWTQWRADRNREADRRNQVSTYWADRRLVAHQRLIAAADDAISGLDDPDHPGLNPDIRKELRAAVAAVELLGSTGTTVAARQLLFSLTKRVEATVVGPDGKTLVLKVEPKYRENLDAYVAAVREELGTADN